LLFIDVTLAVHATHCCLYWMASNLQTVFDNDIDMGIKPTLKTFCFTDFSTFSLDDRM